MFYNPDEKFEVFAKCLADEARARKKTARAARRFCGGGGVAAAQAKPRLTGFVKWATIVVVWRFAPRLAQSLKFVD
jgi:hypothetical protein